ncbi:MAG: 50S ribosomal protein L3 [Thermodesulfobacteriota bacterium]
MIEGMIGRKLGMTRLFLEEGAAVPVTVIQAGPCTVVQKKTLKKDKYEAVQLGFGERRRVNRPEAGHLKAVGGRKLEVLREFAVDDLEAYQVGDEVTIEMFQVGDRVSVSGTTKGRGFAGVMKRHGFAGGRATHGCTTHRAPGSIGSSADPSHVFRGHRMPGHMGDKKMTVRNLEVVDIRPEYGVILLRGAVPGPKGGVVLVRKK